MISSLQALRISFISPATELPRILKLDRGKGLVYRSQVLKISSFLVSDAQKKVAASPEAVSRESKEVMEIERNVFVGTYARAPVVIKSGRGCKLYDVDGKEYLDMTAGSSELTWAW